MSLVAEILIVVGSIDMFPWMDCFHKKTDTSVDSITFQYWLVVDLPLWKMIEFVSWDDYSIPNWMESHNPVHGSGHHQPAVDSIPMYHTVSQL
jgi:hypothetical protein